MIGSDPAACYECAMKVLVALDESSASKHAARVASQLFGGPDTEFLALSVARVPTAWADPFGGVYALPQSFWDNLPSEGMSEQEIIDVADESGIAHAEPLLDVGGPVERIIAAADEHDVDVIVVGSHDKGFLRRLIDPSISEGVVHQSNRPVLVVNEDTAAGRAR
jgi:nucleotide-binding universal stress UspA family protein